MLHDRIVGDFGALGVRGCLALEEERPLEEMVPPEVVVSLDDSAVHVRDEEDGGQDEETEAGPERDRDDKPGRPLVQTELWRSLVDDRQGADGAGDQEEEGRGPDSPGDRVGPEVDHQLDQHEDDGGEDARDGRSHCETGEDGTEALAIVPAPLDALGTDRRDTDTGDGGHQRVCRGHMGVVTCAPHDPDRCTS